MPKKVANRPSPKLKIDIAIDAGINGGHYRISDQQSGSFEFSTSGLESYAFTTWEPLVYDALLVVAAVEFCDRSTLRPARGWSRNFEVTIPVHDHRHWSSDEVTISLRRALSLLTGDNWALKFRQRPPEATGPILPYLNFDASADAVLAHSGGLDSRAVEGIYRAQMGDRLIPVHVDSAMPSKRNRRQPFVALPYKIRLAEGKRKLESRASSRGFRFAMVSGVAAHLTGAKDIIIPESGQGCIGPALSSSSHIYPDYRCHPLFTNRMERLFRALFGKPIAFSFPQLWQTKSETLRRYRTEVGHEIDLCAARSCWRDSRWVSVGHTRRQCGVCSACILRKVAAHNAGIKEAPKTYVFCNLRASTLEKAKDPGYRQPLASHRRYGVAAVSLMDRFAQLASKSRRDILTNHAARLAPTLGIGEATCEKKLVQLVEKHRLEWHSFLRSLGSGSVIHGWLPKE